MAFTVQGFVLDPTLAPTGIAFDYVVDPTIANPSAKLPTFVATPTLAVAHLSAFVIDPTLATNRLPNFIVDALPWSGEGIVRKFLPFGKQIAAQENKTANTGRTFAYFTRSMMATTESVALGNRTFAPFTKAMTALPLANRKMQRFTKVMRAETGTVAYSNRTMQPFAKAMQIISTGIVNRQMQPFVKVMLAETGALGITIRTMQPFGKSMVAFAPGVGTNIRRMNPFIKRMMAQVAAGTSYSVISMHASRQALVQYTNFNFNSFCIFNGRVLGASDAGLFELVGDTDDLIPIDVLVAGGVSDFDSALMKNIDRAYVGYRTDGDLTFSLVTHDDGVQYDYPLTSTGIAGIHGRRAITGRGLRSRYYRWKIGNVNGANFALDSVDLKVRELARRVGGTGA